MCFYFHLLKYPPAVLISEDSLVSKTIFRGCLAEGSSLVSSEDFVTLVLFAASFRAIMKNKQTKQHKEINITSIEANLSIKC